MRGFQVWRDDEFEACRDQDERDDAAWEPRATPWRPAPSTVRDAAQAFADHCHAQRDGWEWSWPIDVIVSNGDSYWRVEVSREVVPEFVASREKPFDPPPVAREERGV